MRFEQHKQERQALMQHLLTQEWDVFGTLKFVMVEPLVDKPHISYCAAIGTA